MAAGVGSELSACAGDPELRLAADLGGCAKAGEAGFGCATQRNLEAMVANPADLAVGQPNGPPSGAEALTAVQRLRRGAVRPLGSGDGPDPPAVVVQQAR